MTLHRYDATQLDEIALRLLDLASSVRKMSKKCVDSGIDDLALNNRKALQWLDDLDAWARKAQADLERRVIQERLVEEQARADARRTRRK